MWNRLEFVILMAGGRKAEGGAPEKHREKERKKEADDAVNKMHLGKRREERKSEP